MKAEQSRKREEEGEKVRESERVELRPIEGG